MPKIKINIGDVFGKWILHEFIDEGGNGVVWKANEIDNANNFVAIKILKSDWRKSYLRFKDEVKVVIENNDIEGLLPILDFNLPDDTARSRPWYAMPYADSLTNLLKNKNADDVIDVVIEVCKTLKDLHNRSISHRDIKPENILALDGKIYLSDFGLVDYEGKANLTHDEKKVGAVWTIAPEMRRYPERADGKRADVYSLAKTLWILLTGEVKCFDGQYTINPSIDLKKYVPSIYLGILNNLLHNSTEHDPEMRPNINEFSNMLSEWKSINNDFEKRSRAEWSDIKKRLFIESPPKKVIWEEIDKIIWVLNIISEYRQVNHTLFPDGGGLDLEGAKLSCEEGCIELSFNGQAYIVKPKRLYFEDFEAHPDWSYFRLETEGLDIIGTYETDIDEEGLTEIEPGVYSDGDCCEYNDFNGKELPDSARFIVRGKQGAFMICLRTGTYNRISATYDGRHNEITADNFREAIEKVISHKESNDEASRASTKSTQNFKKPQFIPSTKIRKGSRTLSAEEIAVINNVIVLVKKVNKEEEEISAGLGLRDTVYNILDESFITAMAQYDKVPKPRLDEFEKHVQSLTDDVLALLEAVMYGGRGASSRGRAYPLDEMLEQFSKDSRDSRLHAVLGKTAALAEYLERAVAIYK